MSEKFDVIKINEIYNFIHNNFTIVLYNNFKGIDTNLKFITIDKRKVFGEYIENHSLENVASAITLYFKINKIDYPYLRMMGVNIYELFNNIRKTKNYFTEKKFMIDNQNKQGFILPLEFINTKSQKKSYCLYDFDYNFYNDTEILGDYFLENTRLQCKRSYAEQTPFEMWYEYDKSVIKTIENILEEKKSINLFNMREGMQKKTVECSGELASFYYHLFSLLYDDPTSITVIDGCAGYGTRLLGSMIGNVKHYLGIDPNVANHNGYNEMIKEFKKYCKSENKYELLVGGLPDIHISASYNEYFDVCLFSPPSFNTEIYSQDTEQSIMQFNTKEDWTIKFLYATLQKLWRKIKFDGYFVLQSSLNKTINPYIHLNLPNSFYCGCVAIKSYFGRSKPVWIWKKVKDVKSLKLYHQMPSLKDSYDAIEYNLAINTTHKTHKIAFITEKTTKWYVHEMPNINEIAKKYNVKISVKTINDDLAKYDKIVLSACWNYYLNPQNFLQKIKQNKDKVINHYKTIEWNINKKYLFDLEKWGINIFPTIICGAKDTNKIKDFLHKYTKIVIKPLIGAGSHKVFIINNLEELENTIEKHFVNEDFILQKYMKEIEEGFYYLVFFNYTFSHHCVFKLNDTEKVMSNNNKYIINKGCSTKFIDYASNILQIVKSNGYNCVYARIDGINVNNNFYVMELELIEPGLLFYLGDFTTENYIKAILHENN